MQKTLLSMAAVSILAATASLPTRADAMGIGTAAAIDNALSAISTTENVRYVCSWRYGRRICWWVPSYRSYRPYRYYRPYSYYRPYRSYRPWRYW
jgi:hypothetical protein